MIYLYLGKNTVKLISLSKTLFGQFNVATFQKHHETTLIDKGEVKNVDVLASAVKEALTSASEGGIKDSEVYLVLPEESFYFARYDVPHDIQNAAIVPFIKDKVRADVPVDLDNSVFDYLLVQHQNESVVLFYAIKSDVYRSFSEALSLLGLSVKSVVPETLTYYKLFEKTLKKDKREHIMFLSYDDEGARGYVYDSFGLTKEDKLNLTEPLEKSIKDRVEKLKKDIPKIDRIILSGEKSKSVRQDTFTKNVGVWTNPLEKIVLNFYTDYLKIIVLPDKSVFPFLSFDVCLGAFILHRENPQFLSTQKSGMFSKKPKFSLPSFSFNLPIHPRDIIVFVISTVLSFSVIALYQNFKGKLPALSIPNTKKEKEITIAKPTNKPTEKPTPSPSFKKEEVNIKILNGGGVKGKATEIKDILKEKGYVEILTGNADNFDYSKSEVQVKPSMKEAGTVFIQDLSKYVKISKPTNLDEDNAADIIFIVGSDFE